MLFALHLSLTVVLDTWCSFVLHLSLTVLDICFTSELDCRVGHLVLFFLHLSLTVGLDTWCFTSELLILHLRT